ncbi:GIY-YIG nuclease family protein [Listeria fleischmannii]|jgi:putative endonuclease|uniref:GIY-YIG nuclease family protein n=1 Tax=Listeria fleischmannii TaxID=1069827 RepID=A0A841YFF7_9LIST|nr:GIY-YIG nuclease family protein [Listeria fleischmannii]EIA19294.1 GIY-YIG nuclease superfamily protein [Listeria fleischmannii subsp. coloradonensis]MBC1399009.1 GIY-YIG nuclease family protein [Listeria fleischmannii]MBC1419983.1 GIY-YIG nuclease family protein [Listeria fleischmannii]MBC1427262.1 GIY-YIG nuclease family protein [Listeria fleischmannii]STY34654.1 GIY-YIG nuclease superfamily protein [Listeria fleischmannii subsp. coloradonensis]
MAKASEHFFYVLRCSDDTFYGGYTTDVIRREAEHNAGIRCKYTKTRRPVKVIHAEKFLTRSEATKAEAAFKKLPRKQKEIYLKERISDEVTKEL